jgi:hypothetical protein
VSRRQPGLRSCDVSADRQRCFLGVTCRSVVRNHCIAADLNAGSLLSVSSSLGSYAGERADVGFGVTARYHLEYAPSGTVIRQGGQASGKPHRWHTYDVDWEPRSVTYCYDGVKMAPAAKVLPT